MLPWAPSWRCQKPQLIFFTAALPVWQGKKVILQLLLILSPLYSCIPATSREVKCDKQKKTSSLVLKLLEAKNTLATALEWIQAVIACECVFLDNLLATIFAWKTFTRLDLKLGFLSDYLSCKFLVGLKLWSLCLLCSTSLFCLCGMMIDCDHLLICYVVRNTMSYDILTHLLRIL